MHALHEATSADLGSGEPKRGPKEPQMDLGGGRLAVHHMGAAGVHRLGYWWGDSGERACAAGASIEAIQTTHSACQVSSASDSVSIVHVPVYKFEFLNSYFTVLVQYEISVFFGGTEFPRDRLCTA